MKTHIITKIPFQDIPLLNNAQFSLEIQIYARYFSSCVDLKLSAHPVKKVTIDSLINLSFKNKVQVNALNFRMQWIIMWKTAKWKQTFGMLDIFVRYEAMNFSTYGASPVEKRRKLILYVYLLSTPDLNYLTIENIKQCLVFNWFLKCVGSPLGIAFTWVNP